MTTKRELPAADDEVREWLRLGDPLAEGMPPDDEIRQWRARSLLAAARRTGSLPSPHVMLHALLRTRGAAITAGVALLAVAVAWSLWISGPGAHSPGESRPPVFAQTQAPTANRTAMQPRVAAPQSGRVVARTRRHPRSPSQPPRAAAGRDVVEPRPLQVQFTTPGGTRIIWVLNPDLPIQLK